MLKRPELVMLGQEIRRRREKLGFSQSGFAFEMDLGRGYYGGIERGERNVAVLNLIRIAKGLNTTVGELFQSIDQQFLK